ncbi:MAG: rhomboid family intramembrane serine protease [Defluviitaleaceae bacterium]|nr:rhomboid family intramembrane serine protease [Defluviitaleaceae bacterium]
MFTQFSARLFEKAVREDFILSSMNGTELFDTSHWVAKKVEMATLILFNVIDATQIDFERIRSYDKKICENTEKVLDEMPASQVANIYILAGGEIPAFDGIEEYLGQAVYSIFWHLNLETGEITVPTGIPKKLFNLRALVADSCNEKGDGEKTSFSEIKYRADALRPKAKHRHAIMSYTIIAINAMVLILMYLDGYHENDVSVPIRFGAIVVDRIMRFGEWRRLFTSMFIHFGFWHFINNSLGLLIFGSRIERFLGRRFFIFIYIFSGLVGSAFSLFNLYINYPTIPSAGASGAIYGLVGAMFAFTRITKRAMDSIGWYVMLIYISAGMALGFATPGIDNFAHIGGLLCGAIIGGVAAYSRKRY